MSGLIGSVLAQAQSLSAQTAAMSTTGKNLSNVNNDGYARQTVDFSTTSTGGVEVSAIVSTRDALIDSQVRNELSVVQSLTAQSNIANTTESVLGEQINTATDEANATASSSTATSTGVATALDAFFNAFSQLASDPTQTAYKQSVVSTAQSLTDHLNYLSTSLNQSISDINKEISSQTSDAQGLLKDIADLNAQIAKVEVTGTKALDLRDTREAKLEKLSKLMNFSISNSAAGLGQIALSATDPNGNAVSLVDAGKVKGTLSFDNTNISFSGITLGVTGGSIAGYQSSKTDVNKVLGSLDKMVNQMVTSVNALYNTTTAGNDFFDAAGVTTGTMKLDATLSAASLDAGTTTDAGQNDVALKLGQLSNKSFSTAAVTLPAVPDLIDGTFSGYYNSVVTGAGENVNALANKLESSQLVYNTLIGQRESMSGVSSNEEASNLIVFQRAFQGNARIISIMDNMLDVVVNSLVR